MWQALVAGLVLIAAFWDIRYHKIPNSLTLAGVVSGLILHTVTDGWAGFSFSLQGAAAGLLILIIPFALGGIGAGDVKLLTAIGALGGTGFAAATALAMAVTGGVMSLGILLWRGQLKLTLTRLFWDGYRFLLGMRPMGGLSHISFPYGVAIAVGTFITLAVW